MPIPSFTIDGILPPYTSPDGPGAMPHFMSPYAATSLEVVIHLGTSDQRRLILSAWLEHRSRLYQAGFNSGFQWLDGSFVEDKEPNDLDVVAFMHRPAAAQDNASFGALLTQHRDIIVRSRVKQAYPLDFFPVDLDGDGKTLVEMTRYWCGLFSHRRGDSVWKGMLKVDFNPQDDIFATQHLAQLNAALAVGGTP